MKLVDEKKLIEVMYWTALAPQCTKYIPLDNSPVIRQKGESQNGCFKKAKHAKISEKQTFLTPWYAHVCVSGGKTCFIFGNFGVLCFLETPVLRFAPLPYYRRIYEKILLVLERLTASSLTDPKKLFFLF